MGRIAVSGPTEVMVMRKARRAAFRVLGKTLASFLPSKSKLPLRYWLALLEGTCETELRFLHKIVSDGEVAIDVGANAGLFSYAMSKRFSKVYAFEINDGLTQDLESYNPGNIDIINIGLSSREGSAVLYIPIVNGVLLTGWASLAQGNCPDAQEYIEKPVHVCTLDKFNISPVSFIKIDVEGHEIEVLKGAVHTLHRDRPVVLIEVKRDNMNQIASFFSDLGYERRRLEDLVAVVGSEENYIFIPKQQHESFQ
jgi:FkbM family methyltransferase